MKDLVFLFLPLVQQSAPPGQAASVLGCGGAAWWVSANRAQITRSMKFISNP